MNALAPYEFDVLSGVVLTGSSAYVSLLLALSLASGTQRTRLGFILALWFAAIVGLSLTSLFDGVAGLGTYAVGTAVGGPVLVFMAMLARSNTARNAVAAAPLSLLVALHAARIFGADFLILQDMGRLGYPFAPIAGWGDIIIGLAALPVAAAVHWKAPGWRPLAWAFTLFGTIDLIVAVALGVMSAPDSPVRLYFSHSEPTLTVLPWLLIPAFLVPSFLIGHIAALRRLAGNGRRPMDGWPATRSSSRLKRMP